MGFGVLIIGDEILSGRREDKHMARVIELLSARGLRLGWARYMGDDRPELVRVLRETLHADDVVFSFGGIGATPDDHTRQAAAEAAGVQVALHAEAAVLIEAQMQSRYNTPATPQHLIMGEFPVGSRIIPNPVNRIPGFSLGRHHFVPGFPQMAHAMVAWVLDNEYAHLHHTEAWAESAIKVFEAPESRLIDLMTQLESTYGVTIFSLPSMGSEGVRSFIELGAKGRPESVVQAMEVMRAQITARGYEWQELPALGA